MVGHYVSHSEQVYQIKNVTQVNKKEVIHTGQYACGIIAYKCPECLHEAVKLSVFLPVRDVEKYEDAFLFENGEVDVLIK